MAEALHPDWLRARWRVPGVASVMTTRPGGVSGGPWESMNLGIAVEDEPANVVRNRALLREAICAAPIFMKQVHGTTVIRLERGHVDGPTLQADACITTEPGIACTVQVADCLPVLFAAPGVVGAAHAGWRGLAGGVIEATLAALCDAGGCQPQDVQCWLGACIGPEAFEVGADVLSGFGVEPAGADAKRFRPIGPAKWLANLPLLARDRLTHAGVLDIDGGTWCTVHDSSRFFSFRRDGVTGRMAAAIWRTPK